MRPFPVLLIAVWVVLACTGCQPVQAPPASSPTRPPLETRLPPSPTPAPSATPALPTLTPTPAALPSGLFVDAAADLGPIAPFVYGSNYGPWLFVTLDTMDAMKASGLTYMRWPGGNWGDLNDVDAYQIDTYLSFCQTYHLEPAISVRLKGGSVERAVAVVNYVKEHGDRVKYWSIGNEPTLYPEYDTERYNREWRAYALAMRAANPNILLLGPEPNQFSADLAANPKDSQGRDWLVEFLKANGGLVDIVAIHRYPFPVGGANLTPTKADLRDNSPEWDAIIPALRALIRQYAGRDLPVAVTEVNSSWATNSGGEATLDSHYNAIWWGDVLGRLIRQGVDVVAQFDLVGDYGLMDKYDPRPMYYVYQLFQKFGSQRVLALSGEQNVSVFAARKPGGELTVLLVNRGFQPADAGLRIAHAGQQPGAAWLFDAEHKAEPVNANMLFAAGRVHLPAESMVLLQFSNQ